MDYDIPTRFKRIYAGPLDSTATFTSTVDLNNYLTNPTRYAGQVVTLVENNEVHLFVLNSSENAWIDYSYKGVGAVTAQADLPSDYITTININALTYFAFNDFNNFTLDGQKI